MHVEFYIIFSESVGNMDMMGERLRKVGQDSDHGKIALFSAPIWLDVSLLCVTGSNICYGRRGMKRDNRQSKNNEEG